MSADLALFPGIALFVTPDGMVSAAHAGFDAPFLVEDVLGRPVHEVLGLSADDAASAALQLWLASSDGVPLDLWRMSLQDPPRSVPACAGRPGLSLEYTPWIEEDEVKAVAVVARIAPERIRSTTTIRAAVVPPSLDGRIAADFARSATDLLAQAEAAITRIDADREARNAIQRLFRAIHTLKGEAQAVDLRDVRDAAHAVEDVLATLRVSRGPVGNEELDGVRVGMARLRAAISVAVGTTIEAVDAMSVFHGHARPVLARMQRCLECWTERPRVRRYGEELRRIAATLVEHATRARLRVFAARARSLAALIDGCLAQTRLQRSVMARIEAQVDELDVCLGLYQQVHLEIATCDRTGAVLELLRDWSPQVTPSGIRLDDIAEQLAAAGVVVIARTLEHDRGLRAPLIPGVLADAPSMFEPATADAAAPPRGEALVALHAARSLCASIANDPESRDMANRLRAELDRIESELTRVGVDDLGSTVIQAGHGLAAELGKRVQIDVDTIGVRVAPEVRRALGEALLHTVRNAIDHGVEEPAQRVAAGKPATARIDVRAEVEGARVIVEIRDDGRGVELERVRDRAIERALIAPEQAPSTPTEALLELLFHPGFSTAAAITHVSGRGVGLDAVRASVQEVGGLVSIATAPGAGTCIRLELPSEGTW